MRGEGRRGEDNHHGEVILGSHLWASPLNSLNLTAMWHPLKRVIHLDGDS